MKKISFTFFFLIQIILVGIVNSSLAQEDVICLKKETTIRIKEFNGRFEIIENSKIKKLFIKNYNRQISEYFSFQEMDHFDYIKSQVQIPQNGKYKIVKNKKFTIVDKMQNGIFYSGTKLVNINYASVVDNSIGITEFQKSYTDPHFLGLYFFGEQFFNVDSAIVSVVFPKNIKINHKIFSTDSVIFKEQIIGENIQYSWLKLNVNKKHFEEKAPSYLHFAPHIAIFIDSYQNEKNENVKILSNVSDLYKWYSSLTKLIPQSSNDSLKIKVKQIIQNTDSDLEKSKRIFKWVQTNIKYLAHENGMAGLIPFSSSDVYSRKYGDCKGMANLLFEMHKIAGLKAYRTWIGTRDRPYKYQDLPCAMSDNHMICTYDNNGKYTFLDATNSYINYGLPTSMIQGKEALIGINDTNYIVQQVDVIEQNVNQKSDSLFLKLENQNISGNLKSSFTGYCKDELEYMLLKNDIYQSKDIYHDYLGLGSNNLSIEKSSIHKSKNNQDTIFCDLKFNLANYAKFSNNKIYVNFNLFKYNDFISIKDRLMPIENEYKYIHSSIILFEIPLGYSIQTIPEKHIYTTNDYELESHYKLENNILIYSKKLTSKSLLINPKNFINYTNFIGSLINNNKLSITLQKKN